MPYKNKRNEAVAEQVRTFSQNHVNREKEINDFSTNYEIPSQLESVVMRQPEAHGGSGFAAATVQDLGFEPTLGATSTEGGAVKRRVRKKAIEVGDGVVGSRHLRWRRFRWRHFRWRDQRWRSADKGTKKEGGRCLAFVAQSRQHARTATGHYPSNANSQGRRHHCRIRWRTRQQTCNCKRGHAKTRVVSSSSK